MMVSILAAAGLASAAIDPVLVEYARKLEEFPTTGGQGSESERVKKLYDLLWDYYMQASPEGATYLGVPGHNDKWSDSSFEAIEFGRQVSRKILAALESPACTLARRRLPNSVTTIVPKLSRTWLISASAISSRLQPPCRDQPR